MSTSAYRLRQTGLHVVPEPEATRRSFNPVTFLRRRRTRRHRALVTGWRDEAIVRSLTKLG
jgi:hypothetical protein